MGAGYYLTAMVGAAWVFMLIHAGKRRTGQIILSIGVSIALAAAFIIGTGAKGSFGPTSALVSAALLLPIWWSRGKS